ncbi:membrane-targeted effector domain-containing toxin [Pseudomonas sp. LP_7_YM]|uniref:membrane-targeted effector domain-containing toxin n=1 Tax=Pseudomonas sp. LP_7_YM TaxID=2485137 RepID=UPI00105DB196|nr:membrane-targeted effector domain-containing toxin [Pseudomonas sp. LP_7_YM]TDV65997.1 multifunctional autoprocessing RTX toxin-like protein [Pseudomonas sp. LP_7_YM]
MQTLSPVPPIPAATQRDAAAALKRLTRAIRVLTKELSHLPQAPQSLLSALDTDNSTQVEQELDSLLHRIDAFWQASGDTQQSRHSLFATCLEKALYDEAVLKSHENELAPDALACIARSDSFDAGRSRGQVSVYSLHAQFNEQTRVEIKGALVMTSATGRTLLAMPGSGLTEYATQQAMSQTLAGWLNNDMLRWALLINADQRHQDAAFAVAADPDLFIERFGPSDIHLQPITTDPYRHALQRQIDKQCEDIRYVCTAGLNPKPQQRAAQIAAAIGMSELFGPSTMLERREQALAERKMRTSLPDWVKIAAPADLETYIQHVNRYDQASKALTSALKGAASAEQYARVSLRTHLTNDLGYEVEPDDIAVTTRRTLPLTDESYTTTRTLTQLALLGVHPDDQQAGSDFLTRSTIDIDDRSAEIPYARLTPAYLARTIDELKLRVSFGDYQCRAYALPGNQMLMRKLIGLRVVESAYAAKMQGHISSEDFAIIHAITQSSPAQEGAVLRAQHIRIDHCGILGRILVFRKEDNQGRLERLIMFASDAPRARLFQSFHNETQLLHELVGWTAITAMKDYLLQQSPVASRPGLNETLEALRQKPYPAPGFIQLISLDSYDAGLRIFVRELIDVTLSEHQAHTPDWYVRASGLQRQQLVALDDAIAGAARNYQAHTTVQDFEDYVHQRASENIAQLMKVPAGAVDPDQILIVSERETLTYTQMMRNGYDDSISLITPTAATTAVFRGPQGVDLSALTPTAVARSVHGKWLADDYAALIRRNLLSPESTGYTYRRQASTLITQLQMQAAALRSLLKGHIDPAQYQWLAVATASLGRSDARTRERYPVYPLQIHIDKPFIASHLSLFDQLVIPDANLTQVETVQGCFALLSTENRLAPLLYTPGAPDGIEFRVFSSFVESLEPSGMIDYYKDRCRIKARRALAFFLNDMKQGNANKRPSLPKEPIADFAQVCFNRPIERKLRDAEQTTIGRHDMLGKLIWNSIDIIATVLTLPFPPASFTVGVMLSLRDSVRAFQALTGDSPEDAHALILASALNMVGAAGDLHQGLKGFGAMARKLSRCSGTPARPSTLKKLSNPAKQEKLYPANLQDQSFLIGKPNASGQAPVYRSLGVDPEEVAATRHYATRDSNGAWQPLDQPATPTLPRASDALANRAVDISLQDLPQVAEGHARGVSLGQGRHYIQMNGLVYQVQYDAGIRCWHIVDPDSPFAFFGRQPVRLDDHGQWTLVERSRLQGGGNDEPFGFRPLQEQSGSSGADLSDYELPQHLRRHLEGILKMEPADDLGLNLDGYFEIYYVQMRERYFSLKEKLYADAQTFFARSPALPPRPILPAVDASANVSGFLENVFNSSNGLVLSEAPRSVASKHFLIAHMQALVEQRVETMYLPHLFTDKHLKKLAKYRAKGKNVRSGSHEIRDHLELINEGALNNLSVEYDYYHLIKHAHRHGIEVRPFSSSVSYPVEGFEVATPTTDIAAAQKMSNFFGHKVISADVALDRSKRWIALLDEKLATTHDQVPGIAELEGAISVHIEDVPAGRPMQIRATSVRLVEDGQATPCDFKIEFANPIVADTAIPAALPTGLDDTLTGASVAASGHTHPGVTGFRWDESSGWQRVAPEHWVADSPPTALQQSLLDTTYGMPPSSRDALYELIQRPRGLDGNYFISDTDLIPAQSTFFELREKLRIESRPVIFGELAPRPTMPAIDTQGNVDEFIKSLYQQTDGMVIGEFHASVASKKFIMDNLPLLTQQNVKTLYMEHLLTDLHQADLDRFFDTGLMSKRLLDDIKKLDSGHLTDPDHMYNFEKLLIKAQQHGLEIRALDCAASYHLRGIRLETPTTRQQMMNYFASRTIRQHQSVMGKHRWVALVGNSHANIYKTVPGLAELEGAIGLHLVDVAPGASKGIRVDAGVFSRSPMNKSEGFVKGDFRIDVEIPGTPVWPAPIEKPTLDQRLSRVGTFVVESESETAHMIAHRSRDNAIHLTPVQFNAEGKAFVERPTWEALHLQPHETVEALILALQRYGLERVG